MERHQPAAWKAVLVALLGCLGLFASASIKDGRALWAFYVFSGSMWLISIIEMFCLVWEAVANYNLSIAEVARSMKGMTEQEREALGFFFPRMMMQIRATSIDFIFSGNATVEDLERFVNDSDQRQVSPERHWAEGTERQHWQDILDWMISHGYVMEDSAAGSHSWLWVNNGKAIVQKHILAPYYIKTKRFANLNKERLDA